MTHESATDTEARVAAVELLLQAMLVETASLVERPQEALKDLEHSAAMLLDVTGCDEHGASKAANGRSIGDIPRVVRRQLNVTLAP